MPDWGMLDGQLASSVGSVPATSLGTTVVSGAANVKTSAWTELIAATDTQADSVWVVSNSSTGQGGLYDIAIGPAGAEVIIAANLGQSSGTGNAIRSGGYYLPISIPAGTRISAKSQSTLATQTTRVTVNLFAGGFATPRGLSRVTTYGADTADSGGTFIDAGATAHTKGAWSVLSAETENRIKTLTFYVGIAGNLVRSAASFLMDIGVGATGAEQVLIPNIQLMAVTTEDIVGPQTSPPLPLDISAGERLVARCQSTITTSPHRGYDLIIFGCD